MSRPAAGIRSFALASLLGAVSVHLGGPVLLGLAEVGLALLLLTRAPDAGQGMATRAALLLTLALGGLCLHDRRWPPPGRRGRDPAGGAIPPAPLRAHGAEPQRAGRRADPGRGRAGRAALLPDTYLGPFDALNPRTLWKFTLLVMTISAGGHVALRLFGPRIGLPLAGFASGFISSTLTVGTMGQRVAAEPLLMGPAVAGAPVVGVHAGADGHRAGGDQSRGLAGPGAAAGVQRGGRAGLCLAAAVQGDAAKTTAPIQAGRPFTLQAALTLALVAAAALIAAAALDAWLGPRGITVAAVLGGLVDTHAAAASVAALAAADRIDPAQTVVPVLAALSANAASKAVYAVISGGRRYAVQVIPGLLLMIAAAWAGYAAV